MQDLAENEKLVVVVKLCQARLAGYGQEAVSSSYLFQLFLESSAFSPSEYKEAANGRISKGTRDLA